MNVREISNFISRKPIRAALVLGLMLCVSFLVYTYRKSGPQKDHEPEVEVSLKSEAKDGSEESAIETISKNKLETVASAQARKPQDKTAHTTTAGQQVIDNIPMTTLSSVKPAVSEEFAPYGRLIEGTLRTTIKSSNSEVTPVIVVVTKPLYFKGNLIISAGSTIHCTAKTGQEADRVYVHPHMIVNEFSGEEMPVKGYILNRDVTITDDGVKTWGLFDSTPGVIGHVIKSDKLAEIKIFIATFMSAFVESQKDTYQNALTGQNISQNNAGNAGLAGTQAVINRYADQILESIRRDGFFVLVPSGRDVWIYLEQTLDTADYTIGASKKSIRNPNQPTK